ncbi:class I SAM-dependent methyltransferase [Halalkalibacter alkaliphilus]|uniref:Methyltransferase domain-containing protein n=1 Tax=Halalkalibacter alkaliphilus TaxID=2917993 RepID=A0A9X2CW67_9BACI|nr:methyltransferase domain-containing protein [Halalkalibacter alkaliphilus]MCL7749398.1 methyltransferase domain-containing protein [Halalkalibacter alkaliphilus]
MDDYSYVDFLCEIGIGSAHPGGVDRTKYIFQKELVKKEMKVLDVGCGTGDTALFLREAFHCKVDTIENHSRMIETIQKKCKEVGTTINVVEGSVEQMPFSNNTYDYIICESVLAFVDANQALEECYRVLKDKGILILNEMSLVQSLNENELNRFKGFYQLQECNTENQWKEKLEQTGFTKIDSLLNSTTIESQPIEISLSPNIDPKLLDMLDEHQRLQQELDGKVGSIVLRCQK